MGVQYNYYCDICSKIDVVEIPPFEVTDPGESTPIGWAWQDDGSLYCDRCGGELG